SSQQRAQIKDEFVRFEQQARQEFQAEGWKGSLRFQRSADLRYQGQGYELNIPLTDLNPAKFLRAFHRGHQRRYGYSHPERDLELVTLRLRGSLPSMVRSTAKPKFEQKRVDSGLRMDGVYFDGRSRRTAILSRESLVAGRKYRGPAVVTEYSATTLAPPQSEFVMDGAGNLLINC
ncbi:MAG: hypothetical protein DMG68_15640, partial [Acidobacteria bacterium]